MKIGIIGAMDVEVEHLKAELADARVERVASSTDFCSGRLGERTWSWSSAASAR